MVIKNCEDKYTYLFRVTKGLKTINAKTTTFSGSRFLVVFLIAEFNLQMQQNSD